MNIIYYIYYKKKEIMAPSQPLNNRKKIEKKYSKELQLFLEKAKINAHEIPTTQVTPSYFIIQGLNDEDSMLYKTLCLLVDKENINKIYDEVYEKINKSLTPIKPERRIILSPEMSEIIEYANKIREENGHDLITTDHVLVSILFNNLVISDIFEKYGVNHVNLMLPLNEMHGVTTVFMSDEVKELEKIFNEVVNTTPTEQTNNPILDLIKNTFVEPAENTETKDGKINHCINLNKLAETNKIDKVYGRDEEYRTIFEILNRRKNNNIIIVGDNGVGKTCLVEGLAYKIVNNLVPNNMSDKTVWKLNASSLIAGTQFRGMIEERINKLVNSLKKNKKTILFIDNIHTLTDNNKPNDTDLLGLLNDILVDGDVKVIATTNFKGYKKFTDSTNSQSNKFQKIVLDKPSQKECFKIISNVKTQYEKHHKVFFNDNMVNLCIKLADRYNSEKTLPTSAIDLIDQVGSYCNLQYVYSNSKEYLERITEETRLEIKEAIKKDNIKKITELETRLSNINKEIANINKKGWDISKNPIEITEEDIYYVVSKNSGVPVTKIVSDNNVKLKTINEDLKKVVIGQNENIDKIANAIRRGKIGLNKKNKPIASFLFVGNSGSGKTYLSKKIAELVFGDEKYLNRFDMSEYSDKTSVNKLIGTGAGYVGYENGGLLTEAIRKQKFCVLLIDEIEKADENIFNTFLQILDEGNLTDNNGKKVDFKNTVVIMTSNVGTKNASMANSLDFNNNINIEMKRDIIEKEMKNKFPPEFLNRFDDIIYFNNLSNDALETIIGLELEKLIKNISNEGYCLKTHENVQKWLFNKLDKDNNFGARPILRLIQTEIENKLIDEILENPEKKEFYMEVENNTLKIT